MSPTTEVLLCLLVVAGLAAASSTPLPLHTAESVSTSMYLLCQEVGDTKYSVQPTSEGCPPRSFPVAHAVSNFSFDALGWDFFQVTSHRAVLQENATHAYFTAGYIEGYLTASRINNVMIAFNATAAVTPADQLEWVATHVQYMRTNVVAFSATDPYWRQVGLLLAQIDGMAVGYDAALVDNVSLPSYSFLDLFLLNFSPELSDVADALPSTSNSIGYKKRRDRGQHCSGFVKVTDRDLFVGHATWSSYTYLVRQYKIYEFETTIAFSSAAGTISSGDDWYITSNNISSIETTNGYYNKSLNAFITPFSVSEFLRSMVANYLATNGLEWVNHFQRLNSGTYNNQWMVVNYNLYRPGAVGSDLPYGLLWVAEQIPGNVTSGDETVFLRNTSYWASFNTPFFKNIFEVSGYEKEERKWGPLFSYTKYARPEIFKRNQSDVIDLTSMQRMMRFNDWQSDPLSTIPNCTVCAPATSPLLSVASRGDLVGSNFILPSDIGYAEFFMGSAFGAIDAKVASNSMLHNHLQGTAICGPTTDQQPPFRWSEYQPGGAPPGSVDLYNFTWVSFNHIRDLDKWM